MERCVKVSHLKGHAHGNDEAEENGDEPRDREVGPVLHSIQLSQHENNVDEHDAVATDHADGVEGERFGGNVTKAEMIGLAISRRFSTLVKQTGEHLRPLHLVQHSKAVIGLRQLLLLLFKCLLQLALPLHGERVRQVELDADHRSAVSLVILVELGEPAALQRLGPDDPARGVELSAAEEGGEVDRLPEHGTRLDVVDGLQDLRPRELPDDVLIVVPQLEDGSLGAVVLERLDDVAVDVGGQSAEQLWRERLYDFFSNRFVVDLPPVDVVDDVAAVAATPIIKVEAIVWVVLSLEVV